MPEHHVALGTPTGSKVHLASALLAGAAGSLTATAFLGDTLATSDTLVATADVSATPSHPGMLADYVLKPGIQTAARKAFSGAYDWIVAHWPTWASVVGEYEMLKNAAGQAAVSAWEHIIGWLWPF